MITATYTNAQLEVINMINDTDTDTIKLSFNGDSSKVYTLVMGCNGSAIKSLLKAGVIEMYNHPIYKQMYRMVK